MKLVFLFSVISLIFYYGCSGENKTDNYKKTEVQRVQNVVDSNQVKDSTKMSNIYDVTVKDMDGNMVPLSKYKGKVLMIVNTASKCGFTRQYEGLQTIYERYKDKGFEILAFPSNDFGQQEPGTNEEIYEFCSTNFGTTFKLFDKSKVTGEDKNPLYAKLTDNPKTGKGEIEWNFEKFIVSKNGEIVERYKSKIEPTSSTVKNVIEKELAKKI